MVGVIILQGTGFLALHAKYFSTIQKMLIADKALN